MIKYTQKIVLHWEAYVKLVYLRLTWLILKQIAFKVSQSKLRHPKIAHCSKMALIVIGRLKLDLAWCKLLGLGRKIGQINIWAFGVFSAELSALILVQWVPCPCFPLLNHCFYKKLSLYIHIQNIYLELGFEFGSQRIRDLAFMCPKSVVAVLD